MKGIVTATCTHVTLNYWRICWIEHGKPRCKYVESVGCPEILTFAQIRRKKEIPEKEILKHMGLSPGAPKETASE